MLPEDVLLEAQKELLSLGGCGMSVMELSHRGKQYEPIHMECISLFKELMGISDDYYVLLLQGGASLQFEAVPLNLLIKGRADYVVTGNFSSKAYKEAKKFGDIKLTATSEDKNYTYIPKVKKKDFRTDIDYVHYTANNTIFGSRWNYIPEAPAPLACDMSSSILSEEVDVSKFGLIYAGAQKNVAPAGLTVVIVKKSLTEQTMPLCPTMLKYGVHGKDNSLYNTPPCFAIYVATLNLRYLKKFGGVKEIQKVNEYKAGLLYGHIDNSKLFSNHVAKEDRSLMNVPFTTGNEELDAKFVKESNAAGFVSLKGHRLVGGMRASIYNGMPVEGVTELIDFMKKFETANK
jgi:phosphoserine aminotransferase